MSDDQAELLVRWMWKIAGLFWIALIPGRYTNKYTLRERVLYPIDAIRGDLVLGVAMFDHLHTESKDLPMGLDSATMSDAIFVSGVFSKIAMMVVLEPFEGMIPPQFGKYRLAPKRDSLHAGKLFYPPTTFKDDVVAVQVTRLASSHLEIAHDWHAQRIQTEHSATLPR